MVWGTDDFNRAALGTDWNIGAGTWDIATSTNLRNTTSSGIIGHTPSQPTTQDQVIQFQMLGPAVSTKVLQLRCRMNATATHYFAMRVSNVNISFRAAVGAGEVTIGSTYSFTRAAGDTYRFEVEGTGSNILLRAYLNDMLVNSFTANNAVVGTSTCINPSGTGTNQLFDNYAGGDLSSKPGTAQQYQVSGTVPVTVGASARPQSSVGSGDAPGVRHGRGDDRGIRQPDRGRRWPGATPGIGLGGRDDSGERRNHRPDGGQWHRRGGHRCIRHAVHAERASHPGDDAVDRGGVGARARAGLHDDDLLDGDRHAGSADRLPGEAHRVRLARPTARGRHERLLARRRMPPTRAPRAPAPTRGFCRPGA